MRYIDGVLPVLHSYCRDSVRREPSWGLDPNANRQNCTLSARVVEDLGYPSSVTATSTNRGL